VIIFIVPKNSGLSICKSIAEKYSGEIIEVRGEDVPLITLELIKQGKNARGITGEDLFKEFTLEKRSNLEIRKRIKWNEESFIFKKPALCLLGPKEKNLDDFPKNLKICINKKYKELVKKYCTNLLENKKYKLKKIYVSGASEEFFSKGLADLVIDVVCSGKSADYYGLKVYDKLFESDIVVLGSKDKFSLNSNKKFDLNELYKKITNRIGSKDKKSYTRKLIDNPNFLRRKIVEEAGEVITENPENKKRLIEEFADLFYNILVYMALNKITIEDIEKENLKRDGG
jgi:phosphoribosyl-ATP pyrophosphohydrolase